ncbi:LysR family transcriptional regulator [Orenia metallireducens]|jgi:DNA-binding transcriptional LysR family regulator|uniref:LysR family transcriptional regulator n=1 Tax=Orenia metallireducens TaxID=1413210 RepID=A0A1C0AD16_9FIRM|nr:LysR family transcriptional regulator [Orenia metallireducens]OCL28512.1 LysR family transcriptional regulator [Orenia metallireducens]
MNINYELYKVFYYVAKYLSFSKAADELFISQSAVSQSIKSLEEELNTSLFIRSTKRVKLSKEGEILLKHIEPALNLIKSGERNIQEINSFEKGQIHIGANDTISKDFLLPYLKKFHQLYPQIHIQITNRTSSTCVELLKQGAIDLIITNLPNNKITDFMEVNEIFIFKDIFISGYDFKELQGREIELKTLADYPILMLERKTTTRKFFDELMEKFKVEITPEVELGSIDLLIEMAKIGLGISFVPNYCINRDNSEIFKIDIKEKLPERKLAVVTNKNIPFSIASKKFIELLIEI